MAKKVVATLKTGTGKQFTKCIKMVKSEKTGSYMFKEGVIANDQVKAFLMRSNKYFKSRTLKYKGHLSGCPLCFQPRRSRISK